MPSLHPRDKSDLPLEVQLRIDPVCARFDEVWHDGETPNIESYLNEVEEPHRPYLFRELLRADIEFRQQRGLDYSEEFYRTAYAARAQEIRFVFSEKEHRENNGSAAEMTEDYPAPGSKDSDVNFNEGRFPPGTLVADRFQIIRLLGKGGMGEVYLARTLISHNQPASEVALKFLPQHLAHHPQIQAALVNEVTHAQRVTHRHVCRVHDLHSWHIEGESQPLQFVAMEYVDGEQLDSFLARKRSISYEAKLKITQQILAGLAEAHRKGVIHRDLKPANIMIDRDENIRIMDFGLAVALRDEIGSKGVAGTRGYIAPEIFEGKKATYRSDIFSLGQVLYEIFAGKRAFEASVPPETGKSSETSSVPPPSHFVGDLDPRLDQAVLRCLETDPKRRSRTVPVVAAELLGFNFKQFAETERMEITPELVIAMGGSLGWKPARAAVCFAGVLMALIIIFCTKGRVDMVGVVRLKEAPAVLAKTARSLLKELNYDLAGDQAYGFSYHFEYPRHVILNDSSAGCWNYLPSLQPPAITFWYRQSPDMLTPILWLPDARNRIFISPSNPPLLKPGMVLLRLDPDGNLVEFQALPKRKKGKLAAKQNPTEGLPEKGNQVLPAETNKVKDFWLKLLSKKRIGFDLSELDEKDGFVLTTAVFSDEHRVWIGKYPKSDIAVRVEAATYQGKLVYFKVQPIGVAPLPSREGGLVPYLVLFWGVVAAAVLLAGYNLRNKKADVTGTVRIGVLLFGCFMTHWLLAASHRADLLHETYLLSMGLASGLMFSVLFSTCYLALEPFTRRLWPESLTSWSRALAGQFREPLVGQHLAIGALLGAGYVASSYSLRVMVWAIGVPLPPIPNNIVELPSLLGTRQLLGNLATVAHAALVVALMVLMLLLVLRRVLRRRWLAGGVFLLVVTVGLTSFFLRDTAIFLLLPYTWLDCLAAAAISLFLMTRFGLLSAVAYYLVARALTVSPVTSNMQSWYAGGGLFVLAAIAALAGYACWISLGNKHLFSERFVA